MPVTTLSEVKSILVVHDESIKEQLKLLRRIDAKFDTLLSDVGRIQPRSYLPPLRKPTQEIDYARNLNVAGYLSEEIKKKELRQNWS